MGSTGSGPHCRYEGLERLGGVCGGAPSRGPSQELVDAALVAAPALPDRFRLHTAVARCARRLIDLPE
jgi:hypothetical protein